MAEVHSQYPSEKQIQDKFFHDFLARRSSVRVKNWTGWSYRKGRTHSEVSLFYREFDLAQFHIDGTGLVLSGYEVKGWRKVSIKGKEAKMVEPAFGDGLDQALALLEQGADFASVIYPEPKKQEDKEVLKRLCDHFAPNIGIIYVQNDLTSFYDFRPPQHNLYTNIDRKKKMLSSLMTGGTFSDISELRPWAKQQKY
jgi:hypothetical protein